MNLAQQILKQQQKIDANMFKSMGTPIEPTLTKKQKESFRKQNPYSDLPEVNMLNDLQLAQILKDLNITLPVGILPSSPQAMLHINTQLRIMQDVSGEPIKTIYDLIRLKENKQDKILLTLNDIADSNEDMLTQIIKTHRGRTEEIEEPKKRSSSLESIRTQIPVYKEDEGQEEEKEEEKKEVKKSRKLDTSKRQLYNFSTNTQIKNMSNREKIKYIKDLQKNEITKGLFKGYTTTKTPLADFIISKQNEKLK